MGEIEDILEGSEDCDPNELLNNWTSEFYESELDQCKKSLCVFPRNYVIGVSSDFLDDSWQSEVLCSFRAGNARLGNRAPTPEGLTLKLCHLCGALGKQTLVNELHIILCCPFLESIRLDTGLRQTITKLSEMYNTRSPVNLIRLFLGEDSATPEELKSRAIMLHRLRIKWYNLL